jgi:hypothetical protein
MRIALRSVAFGCCVGSLPYWLSKLNWDSSWIVAIKVGSAYLLLPGMLVGLLLSMGRYDDIRIGVAVVASCCFYSGLFYFLARRRRAKAESREVNL